MTTYCIDDRHGTPNPLTRPQPCDDECDPSARVEALDPVAAARAAGWDDDYIAAEQRAGRLPADTPTDTED